MSEPSYYWQGGRKIAIEQKINLVTIEAPTVDSAFDAADAAGVEASDAAPVSNTMVKMRLRGDRDAAMAALRSQGEVLHHVYNTLNNPSDEVIITESFYLKFKKQATESQRQALVDSEHLKIVEKLDEDTWLVGVTNATGTNPLKSANKLAEADIVQYAEPNIVHSLKRFNTAPGDNLFPKQWHLHTPTDGIDLAKDAGIDVVSAWKLTKGDRKIVVCVADDGFDLTHPDLKGADKIAGKINIFRVESNDIATNDSVQPRPGDYHGTPCAGVAIAEVNAEGCVGVAPECSFLAVRFPLSVTDTQLAKMFQLISSRADVVSCSWGYGPADKTMSIFLRDTITELSTAGGRRGKGLVFCVAAGSSNCPIKDLSNNRTYKYLQNGILRSYSGPIDRWIAAHGNVITVTASTSLKTRAAYSSWGREINVCAPSNNFDDLNQFTPRGLGIVTTDNEGFGERSDFEPDSRYTSKFGGTSSATPTVAGVCALVLSVNPNLTAGEVLRIIQETADKELTISSETQVNEPGDFVNGFSLWFGHGKVNARRAVLAASQSSG